MKTKELIQLAEKKLAQYDCEDLKTLGILPKTDQHHVPIITYPMYSPENCPKKNEGGTFLGINKEDIHPFVLYLHVPFCKKFCTFCQYDTCIYKSSQEIDLYLSYIEKEIMIWKKSFPKLTFSPTTCFIGGGTPTSLNANQFKKFLKIIHKHFNFENVKQFSIDVEPHSICGEQGVKKLKVMKDFGINRICLGAQSFDNSTLQRMNRPHKSKNILTSIKAVKKVGFESLLLDLIFGYPGSSLETWIDTLKKATKLDIDGYQIYQIRVLPYRPKELKKIQLREKYKKNPKTFLSSREIYLMKMTNNIIAQKNGYKYYGRGVFLKNAKHISQYLKLGCERQYNVIGLGKGAFSFIKNRAFMNLDKDLKNYYNLIDQQFLPVAPYFSVSTKKLSQTLLIMSLKNRGKLNKNYFKNKTGTSVFESFGASIKKLKKYGFLKEDKTYLSLTAKGIFFEDDILLHFFDIEEIPLPRSAYSYGPMNPFLRNKKFKGIN